MNYKFFGNSLDLFKYDILTYIVNNELKELEYTAMLTLPEEKKNDPKYKLYEVGSKNKKLLNFIDQVNKESLPVESIDLYFKENLKIFSNTYFKDSNNDYFSNDNRETYFNYLQKEISNKENILLFLDPDVGLDLGITRRVRSNKQMYLFKDEVHSLLNNRRKKYCLAFFQHLGNHRFKLEDRLERYKEEYGKYVLIIAYERILASIIFILQDEISYNKIRKLLEKYIENYKDIPHSNKLKLL